jgi:glycosyltransferase involved in cell wall biosynthesis
LPKKYFLISNQLWVHKDHKTAFKALWLLRRQEYTDIHIICTGQTYDFRFPSYYQEVQDYIIELGLETHIHFLGFIPKIEQIAILQKSIAIIQPTLFEGGPGGGAAYDAVAYGVPAIVSDIPVNTEIQYPLVVFFKVGNAEDLCQKMISQLNNPLARPSLEELQSQRVDHSTKGSQFLERMFYEL